MLKRLFNYYTFGNPKESYTANMLYFDQNGSQNFEDTTKFFSRNAGCAASAITSWWKDIQNGIPPATAAANTEKLVENLYASGVCTITPKRA